ncbi:MAG: hypothetical protein R3296_10130 [Oleiphilaceae bacterium]|nr:hypothetical protein [Oleiphilaceae bacterium]
MAAFLPGGGHRINMGIEADVSLELNLLNSIWLLPLVAAVVGWSTNWLAIFLSFRPVRYLGLRPFPGWQGVIPRNSERMAHICIDQTLERFGDLQTIYERLDPQLITGQVLSEVLPRVDEYIDEVMYELQPVLWDNLPLLMRRRIYHWARQKMPERIEAMVEDFGYELGSLIDLKALISKELRSHPALMNEIFQEAGEEQFRFLKRSGAVIGGALGALFMTVWWHWPLPWLLPLAGFAIGFVTNWLALNLIFRPLYPVRILGFEVQGLFLRRQPQISAVWADKVAHQLLTVDRVAYAMVHGDQSHRTRAIIQKHLRPLLDQSLIMKMTAQMAVGVTGYSELKQAMNDTALQATDEVFSDHAFSQDRANIVASMIRERVSALPPEQFQQVLRPAFQEEEWLLMLAGGVMGGLIGLLQLAGMQYWLG